MAGHSRNREQQHALVEGDPSVVRQTYGPGPRLGPFLSEGIDDDTISENGSSWFWANLCCGSAGKMCLPMHQRTDAVRLFEPRRYGAGKLPNVGVSEHGPYSSSDPTSSTSTARDVGVFSAGRAPRLSLSETALEQAKAAARAAQDGTNGR
jgi:hypothetical protein